MSRSGLPPRVLAWYGDDFTGSTDVLEVLALAGLPAVLFLRVPDDEALDRFPEARAIGVAGESRAKSPEWMERELPAVFERLGGLGARLVHYKVCSTFDSSPAVGSIGRALDIGRRVLGSEAPVPVVVGAPALKRYCAFGNLFATAGETHRLDRHPTMSRHPVTPMDEADLRRHLARQTDARVALFDVLALWSDATLDAFHACLATRPDAVLFDIMDARSLERCGELVWTAMPDARFAVASSGLEYALAAYWRQAGLVPAAAPDFAFDGVERMAVVSGSCSPATALQIRHAEAAGWASIAADPVALVTDQARTLGALEARAQGALAAGRSVVVHTACGPDDPRVAAFRSAVGATAAALEAANRSLGVSLGRLLRSLIEKTRLSRAIVAGGDTSSAAGSALGIEALTFVAPTSPGSPLCRVHARGQPIDGMTLAFKGGQVGGEDYFEAVRRGRPARAEAQKSPDSQNRSEPCVQ